jgi:hypothetical protein
MNKLTPVLAASLVAATLLSACGGSDDDDPSPTPQDSLVTISFASDPALVGAYSSGSTGLSDVEKTNPTDAPQFCSYRFDSLTKTGASSVLLSGRVAYNVNQDLVNNFKVTVGNVTYGSGSTTGTRVDKPANQVTVDNKVLTSESDGVSTITVTARVPMRGNRPDGC